MGNNNTILLAEDEAITAKSGIIILEKYGYHVIHADCGVKAVEIAASNSGIDMI